MKKSLHELEVGDRMNIYIPGMEGVYYFISVDGPYAILSKDLEEIRVSIGRVKLVEDDIYEFVNDIHLSNKNEDGQESIPSVSEGVE